MADAKLTALTAASALAGADLFYVSQSAASRKATGTQLLALVGTAYVPLAGGTMTGALTLPAGSASAPSLSFTGAGSNTGLYSTGSNNISFVTNGARIAYINHEALLVSGFMFLTQSNAALRFGGAGVADVWIQRLGNYRLGIYDVLQAAPVSLEVYSLNTNSSNYERLTLTGVQGSSVNITAETLGTGGDNIDIVLTPAGTGLVKLYNGLTVLSGGISATGAGIVGSYFQTANAGAYVMGNDIGLSRNAAGVFEVNSTVAGTYRDLKLRNLIQTEYSQLTEMTAPAAPATNSVRIYAEDNGAGKTRLMALFATGSAVQLGIEP